MTESMDFGPHTAAVWVFLTVFDKVLPVIPTGAAVLRSLRRWFLEVTIMSQLGKLCRLVLCTYFGAYSLVAQDQQISNAAHPIAIRAARLVDGRSESSVLDGVIVIQGERIIAVGSRLAIPAGATVLDLGDATLLPGLIDSHTHLLLEMDGTDLSLQDVGMLQAVAVHSTAERALRVLNLRARTSRLESPP